MHIFICIFSICICNICFCISIYSYINLVLCFVDYAIGALPWISNNQLKCIWLNANTKLYKIWENIGSVFFRSDYAESIECTYKHQNITSPIFSIFWKLSMPPTPADLYPSITFPSAGVFFMSADIVLVLRKLLPTNILENYGPI